MLLLREYGMMLRFLAIACIFALPAHAFELRGGERPIRLTHAPESIAALSWNLAEVAVDLDLPLIGITDIDGYRTWVKTPTLPGGVRDLGLRNEPNLEAISSLEPDLILASDQQVDMEMRLGRIAPTWIGDQFSADHDNAAVARATYRDIAAAFGKTDLAERRLANLDGTMKSAGDRVRKAWGGAVPPVLPVRLLTPTSLRIHGPNSMAEAALHGMGLTPAAHGKQTEWGFTLVSIDELATYPDAAVVHIDPFADGEQLFNSPLWKAIPAVAAGRFATAEPVWTFGSVVSLGLLSQHLAKALIEMAAQQ